eukprot:m.692550 g.692550  ORF g.692550 m.692550 type:complete len:131 (+) comp58650_c0_seq34:1106-1498(+)
MSVPSLSVRMHSSTRLPEDINPSALLEPFTQLSKGQYPIFKSYPVFVVDYQVQERERSRQAELDMVNLRVLALQSSQRAVQLKQEEDAWQRQWQLVEAEESRPKRMQEEDANLAAQRVRLDALRQATQLQ